MKDWLEGTEEDHRYWTKFFLEWAVQDLEKGNYSRARDSIVEASFRLENAQHVANEKKEV